MERWVGKLAGCSIHEQGGICKRVQRMTEDRLATEEASEKMAGGLHCPPETVLCFLCGQSTCYVWVVLAHRVTKSQKKSGAQVNSTHD